MERRLNSRSLKLGGYGGHAELNRVESEQGKKRTRNGRESNSTMLVNIAGLTRVLHAF
jgi:hypothetical protein